MGMAESREKAVMEFKGMDHLVLTTADLESCLHFYCGILGMRHECREGRHAFYFGNAKMNIHTRSGEFQPAAAMPTAGSLDFCLIVKGNIEDIRQEIESKGWPVETGPVFRHGAQGAMDSIYLRDPDGNLVEIAVYRQ